MSLTSREYLAWRERFPPALVHARAVEQTTSFHDFPAEVQTMILSVFLESVLDMDEAWDETWDEAWDEEWEYEQCPEDITIVTGWKSSDYHFDPASAPPKVFQKLDNVMEALYKSPSEGILALVVNYYHYFVTRFSDTLRKLPRVLTASKLCYISDLDLTLNEGMLNGHEKVLPDVLDVLCNHLPNLDKIYVRRDIDIDIWKEDKDPEMELLDKYAILLRLLAFFTLRRHEDFRVILPADSGPPNETVWGVGMCQSISLLAEKSIFSHPPDRQELEQLLGHSIDKEAFRHWDVAEKFYNDSLTYPHLVEDEILNATAIRKATLSELGSRGPRAFIVLPAEGKHKNNILTSEIPDSHHMYDLVDRRGYQIRAVHRNNFWLRRSVDELILLCREREFQARDRRIRSQGLIAYA